MRQIVDSVGAPFEGVRRFLALGLFFVGFALYMWTDFSPLIKVKDVDFSEKQANLNTWTEENALLAKAPIEDYILAETEGRVIRVDGAGWENFFQKVKADQAGLVPADWKFRHPPDWIYESSIYYRPDEPPFSIITGQMRTDETYYLRLMPQDQWLELWYAGRYEVYSLGGGRIGELPTAMVYPWTTPGKILMVLALLVYILLPWPRNNTIVVQMKRYRTVLMDFAAALMTIPFFVMPFFVVGSFQETIFRYWFLAIWFFILTGLGLMMFYWGYRYASKRLYVYADRFRLYRGNRYEDYLFSEITLIEPLLIRPPKWLIFLTFMSAMAGGSAAMRAGQAGRGMLLAASQSDGLRVVLRNGLSSCLWFGDSFGGKVVKNFQLIPDAVERARLPMAEVVREIRAFFPPER
jgi:hypothetical protein